jgi:alpha-glucoside transport system substrate-binding protein
MSQRTIRLIVRYGLGLLTACAVLIAACRPGSSPNSDTASVTILGSITGEGQTIIEQVFAPFTEATGISVVYEGTDAFATLLPVRVESGNPPDVALFPQPGLMADFARRGNLVALDFLPPDQIAAAYADIWRDLGSVDGPLYGLWSRADVKSLVWYRPDVFAAAGYEIPTTWDEMLSLSDRIVADGGVPWCLGIESGAASGWVGTDWVEDILLRTAGPEVYDQWVTHEIPFTAPVVENAFEQFGAIARNPDYVVGGPVGVISTPFTDAANPLFADPPGCYLHRQANFIASFFPDNVDLDTDVDIFLLPKINPEFGTPVLAGGTVFAMLNDTPNARALMEYLLTVEPHEIWVGLENYVSPHQQVPLEAYTSALTQKQAEILADAEVVRFDGSDLMPGAVGTGSFWTGIVDYVGGADLETVLEQIEASWPQ